MAKETLKTQWRGKWSGGWWGWSELSADTTCWRCGKPPQIDELWRIENLRGVERVGHEACFEEGLTDTTIGCKEIAETLAERVAREWYFGDNSKDEVIRKFERKNDGRLMTQIPLLNALQEALAQRIQSALSELEADRDAWKRRAEQAERILSWE